MKIEITVRAEHQPEPGGPVRQATHVIVHTLSAAEVAGLRMRRIDDEGADALTAATVAVEGAVIRVVREV